MKRAILAPPAVRARPILFSAPMVKALLAGTKTQTRRIIDPQPEPHVQSTPDRHALRHPAPYIDSYCGEKKTPANPRGMSQTWCWWTRDDRQGAVVARCRFGVPGDRLWVRETWGYPGSSWASNTPKVITHSIRYAADGVRLDYERPHDVHNPDTDSLPEQHCRCPETGDQFERHMAHQEELRRYWSRWWPSIFMPRWASRINLEIEDVRIQRVQETSEADAIAEGLTFQDQAHGPRFWHGGPHRVKDKGSKVFYEPVQAYADLWDSINGKRAPWASNPWVFAITFRRVA